MQRPFTPLSGPVMSLLTSQLSASREVAFVSGTHHPQIIAKLPLDHPIHVQSLGFLTTLPLERDWLNCNNIFRQFSVQPVLAAS